MYLVIAEKPSVSNSIAKVLGAYRKKDGYLEGEECVVSWCLGHLAEYAPPDFYDERYAKWNFEDLPIAPDEWKLVVAKDKKEQFSVLKELLHRADFSHVVNACDAGREGELIFKRVYDLSGSRIPVKRLWISSMEDKAILDGFSNLKEGSDYRNLAMAAECRAKADWLIGMNATRAFTSKYHKKLTVGRVQTPTLAMMVDRDEQIRNFKKVPYYNVYLDVGNMTLEQKKIPVMEEARNLMERCLGKQLSIVEVNTIEKSVNPPKLYDLTTLQREANRHYGLTAQQTLNAAQKLYEGKLITYPRTDSQYLTEDMANTANDVIRIILQKYGYDNPFSDPVKVNVDQVLNSKKVSDHHAIIPTEELKNVDVAGLTKDENKVLYLVSMRMLEATGEKHLYTETEIVADCLGENFKAKGKVVRKVGWKRFEEEARDFADSKAEKEKDIVLPTVREGQILGVKDVSMKECFTSPPKAFSEDTLLAAMESVGSKEFDADTEKKGLGTPATRANIIEKLVNTGYAVRKGKQIISTDDGKALIEVVSNNLKSPSLTSAWENQLLDMEKGQINDMAFMTGINNLVKQVLTDCECIPEEETHRFQARASVGTCPVCGGLVYEGAKSFYCADRECRFVLWKENRYLERMKKKIDGKMAAELLKSGRVRVKDLYSAKKDMYFEADLLMDCSNDRVNFSLEFPKNNRGKNKNTR